MFIENLINKDPSIKRHVAKTLTWRLIGTVDTIILGWIISGNAYIGLKIGGFEIITKMLLYFFHERIWFKINFGLPNREGKNRNKLKADFKKNIRFQKFKISRLHRNRQNKHESFVIWFTGLSGSGKSTLANGLEQLLFKRGIKCYALDGDNVRLGINADLDFSLPGRKENIRRVAEISKLMMDGGVVVIASFISPLKEDRDKAKAIIGENKFVEIFVACPLEVCEGRDTKGLYNKARNGDIKEFTGISSPYEIPENPAITIHSHQMNISESVHSIYEFVEKRLKLIDATEVS
jgi:adenylylsulfate kinase